MAGRASALVLAAGLALGLAAGACRSDPDPPTPDPTPSVATPLATPRADSATTAGGPSAPPTPFDAATVVFDTVEPPGQVVQIPPRPAPPPPRPGPVPRPPRPAPPPPPSTRGPSGSCDVRSTEGYCFAFTGEAWTPDAARSRCAAAPSASFDVGTCPLADRIATCAYERPTAPGREVVYTYYAPYDLALAELACPGSFTRIE